MLADLPLIAFVATRDAERSRAFYRDLLGLPLVADEPWALVFQVHGTMLRIQKAGEFTPHPFTALGWQVDDLRETVRGLIARGVSPLRYPHLPADDLGVWSAGDTMVAWFHDPDRNVLSLTQFAR